ncbi:MAG TPA: thiolase family protein [Bacteroidota bacterium]|nr:thiolase family protein [Bacteroidota bacterium]
MPRRQFAEAVIIDAVRTPIGRYGGALRDVRPDDLSAIVLRALVKRTGISPNIIQDVLWGCANQAGEDNRNIGRTAALLAGFPVTVPGTTINRLCGSSMDAVIHAARGIWSGDLDIAVAGGVESMSRAPYSVPKNQSGSYGNVTAFDTALGWRYPNPKMEELFPLESMGETAEYVAEKYKISREDQDRFALASHSKAVAAQKSGAFTDEIVPVEIPGRKGVTIVSTDEGPRGDTSLEKLSQLKPAFRKNGTVTAGNSSTLNDGAAAVLIMSESKARELKLTPIARVVSTGIAGVDPRFMGIGPVPASQQALQKAELTIDQIDLIELNEAFASQSLAVIRDLKIDEGKLNVNGGAIAIGHPLGCSGARILTTLIHSMKGRKARFGLATMCIGVGQGIAVVVEKM